MAPPRSAKPPLRPLAPEGDLPSFVETHPQPTSRGDECCRTPGDSAADDRNVDRAVEPASRERLEGLVKPVGSHAPMLVRAYAA
jgi:hypothetical protein